ncbi:hypothetical protein E5F05_00275 (plasmid) [Deinococcus metallilatus]|uniref:Uncharacterized protein n=1 Tax=Deinococcus metallilatus TaxID=1211322 RepID=A0AAJ5F625_9DEIO|nr:hypothetical protein [Deinococcus metallilatus]MBB5293333.1 hypothetical protein [Deinococcus metallilatus]QBY06440.1 hypothetical protein E5F05_00275 [Deinococcus metallilatus]RXJ18119.1 hypothetical protein ERJ73_01790 [Deinococcus metallilatus]TLK32055.1 hypothetical protein FCS05_00905 [Deinococcus metallilatus]GMA15444.1 hypothetical protein GCM10025871_17750 [Deinococcus metallilatus]
MMQSDLLSKLGRVARPTVWFGLFAAPVAWVVQIDLGLAFTPIACGGNRIPTYLLNGVVLLIGLAALVVTLRLRTLPGQPQGVVEQVTHYLGRYGAWQNGIFLLVIAMTGIIAFFLPACPFR